MTNELCSPGGVICFEGDEPSVHRAPHKSRLKQLLLRSVFRLENGYARGLFEILLGTGTDKRMVSVRMKCWKVTEVVMGVSDTDTLG